jgi:hypothetical protein
MKLSWKHLTVVAVCAGFAVQATMAGAILTRDERVLDALLDVTDLGGSTMYNPPAFTPTLGAPLNLDMDSGVMHSPSDGAEGQAQAWQISSLDASPEFMSISADSYSRSYGTTDDYLIGDAQAEAKSDFLMEFTLTMTMDYLFTGSVTDESSTSTTSSTGRVLLRPLGGSNIHVLSTTGTFDWSGTLEPGTYELIGTARTLGHVFDGGFFDKEAAFDFEFTLVPEPTTALLVLIGCACVMRRR